MLVVLGLSFVYAFFHVLLFKYLRYINLALGMIGGDPSIAKPSYFNGRLWKNLELSNMAPCMVF
jgi:hypothetical protein